MKKIFSIVAFFICVMSQAQTPFITPVTYRGAFAPAPTAMWTTGWTNYDPQNVTTYGAFAADSVINTPITSDRVLTNTKKYRLQGLIYVKNGATLTIKAGTVIKGDHTVANSSLIVTRGSKIVARGTSTAPIVFTSSQTQGSRSKGDWGGVIILGNAHFNGVGGQNFIEGIAQSGDTQYGGGANPNDDDSSGVLSYVRIEFGGYIFLPNQEINGLTLGAVGRKTVIDRVQVSYANDDGFEWFGGSVNCRYLVSYRNLDDDFDADNGFDGSVQFCLAVRDPNVADNPTVSTSEGFETDNDANSTNAKPFTAAVFSNVTEIGPLRGNTSSVIASGYRRNVRIRRNSHLRLLNSVLMDFPTGVFIDGAACTALANGTYISGTPNNNPGNLVFKNNLMAGQATGRVIERNTVWNAHAWFAANSNDSAVSTSGILINPYDYLLGDYRPATGSLALRNFNFNDSAFFYYDSVGIIGTRIACPTVVATPLTIAGRTSACNYIASGDTAKYYITAKSNLGVLRYEWTVPAGATLVSGQGTDTIIVTYSNSFISGNITVTNRSYCGTTGAARTLTVRRGAPTLTGTISGPSFVCSFVGTGDSATYSVSAILNATSYIWTVPTGATIVAGQGTQVIKVLFDNSFVSGSVTVKGSAVCGDGPVRSFVLSKISAAPGLISGKKISCGFTGVPLVYSVAPVLNASSYIWTVPTGATILSGQGTTSIEVQYASAVAGSITVKAVTNCGESIARTQAIAKVGVPVSISGPNLVCPADEPSYSVNDTFNNPASVTYTWFVPVGMTIVSGQGTPTLTVSIDGSFLSGNLSVRANGCGTYSSVRTLSVSKDPGCAFARPVKVASTQPAVKFSVAPNPNKGNFTVYFDSKSKADKGTVQIVNSFGQVVSQHIAGLNNGLINEQFSENKLAPGIYIVRIAIGSEIHTTKMIVQ